MADPAKLRDRQLRKHMQHCCMTVWMEEDGLIGFIAPEVFFGRTFCYVATRAF